MAHKLFIYALEDLDLDTYGPRETRYFSSPDALEAAAREILAETGTVFSFGVKADPALCADIPAYLRVENLRARLLAERPEPGAFISEITGDLDYLAEMGIRTPRELEVMILDAD